MSEQDLSKLIYDRGRLKAFFTRFRTFLNSHDFTVPNNVANLEGRCRDRRFFHGLKQFETIQTLIEQLDTTNQVAQEAERTAFEDTYYELTSNATQILTTANMLNDTIRNLIDSAHSGTGDKQSIHPECSAKSNRSNSSAHSVANYQPSLQSIGQLSQGITQGSVKCTNIQTEYAKPVSDIAHESDSYINNHLKLPPIQLPTFSGEYDQWLQFRDTFRSLVHNNTQIPPIMKFHHLVGVLKGDAMLLIKAIEPSAANYHIAWDMLHQKYENQGLIIDNHLRAIIESEKISKESYSALQGLSVCLTTNLRALANLGEPVNSWNSIIIYIINNKFDMNTKTEWAKYKAKLVDQASILHLQEFLTSRCQLLESLMMSKGKQTEKVKLNSSTFLSKSSNNPLTKLCKICNGNHPLFYCREFLQLSIPERMKKISKLQLCKNCFKSHTTANCQSSSSCKVCQQKHNTLLHLPREQASSTNQIAQNASQQINQSQGLETVSNSVSAATLTTIATRVQILLPSAMVYVRDKNGNEHLCRALLDSCSQSNYITQSFMQCLGLPERSVKFPISGINNTTAYASKQAYVRFQSRINAYNCSVPCLILPEITAALPELSFSSHQLNIPKGLQLADPHFNKRDKIDALLGAEIFWQLVCIGQITLGRNNPICQKTHFGWIISGPMALPQLENNISIKNPNKCLMSRNLDNQISKQLEDFWQIEEVTKAPLMNKEVESCESHFTKTSKRVNGRFMVRLPFKKSSELLGDSFSIAKQRFQFLEKRFRTNPQFKQDYAKFIQEYLDLGHMSAIKYHDSMLKKAYFLPHHGVIKTDSLTTKLRVVFDASCKTSSGTSLNDILMKGTTVQNDLISILLDFRAHKLAFTSDCEKMYRQVLIHPEDRAFQNILWRNKESDSIQTFQLNTVTYGTASAAYLATRCLAQIADDVKDSNPAASEIIKTHFYVDDLIVSLDNTEQAMNLLKQVDSILKNYGFNLRKWTSNLSNFTHNFQTTNNSMLFADESKGIKVLGLRWDPKMDVFSFAINLDPNLKQSKVTKRLILSLTSKLFDPLGLVAPIIVKAKVILQYLWQEKVAWDESVSMKLQTIWSQFYSNLSKVHEIQIPRYCIQERSVIIQLHGFADASETAYGACIYLRSSIGDNHRSQLLCAKSKVAPLKRISLPKLELCASLLLVSLKEKVIRALKLNINAFHFWSDSTVVLAWIAVPAHQLKTFVANRITEILESTHKAEWNHVSSKENPADLVSRGATPESLLNNDLWWSGPSWLLTNETNWPRKRNIDDSIKIPELKVNLLSYQKRNDTCDMLLNSYSCLSKIQRITAYILRFTSNARVTHSQRCYTALSTKELQSAMDVLTKYVQASAFSEEIQSLNAGKSLKSKSDIFLLTPFIHNGIVRVGGRLKHSSLSFNQSHPILIPKRHPFTNLIIKREHLRTFHGGPQLVLATVRTQFWPINGLTTVKAIVNACVTCKRINPISFKSPLMGNLPKERISQLRPFLETGVDYAGPFLVKELLRSGRRGPSLKAYLAIFVCFATKAIHIEVVSNLSTDAFLNALKRFISRRGMCKVIHSDNGTNFQGANNELRDWYRLINSSSHKIALSQSLLNYSIEWKFIPARSPHFGGLWEAAVKSVKKHLAKISFNISFTFEELSTLSTQIEAILNSRPLIPMSCDPNDLGTLTPAHFLVGESLLALPEPDVADIKINRLSRLQLIQHLQQQFWKRWSREYLQTLQLRNHKFQNSTSSFQRGSMVLLKDASPPMLWRRGRILELHPGDDHVTRVVTIRTSSGTVKRAVTQIVALIDDENNADEPASSSSS